ncbi:MAG: hypothetical protein BroJett011_27420 [Chloroflexota bacterium]|nr:MAG: hypothetical protein BroJett011_27420 [Chloroflexota bacterium]
MWMVNCKPGRKLTGRLMVGECCRNHTVYTQIHSCPKAAPKGHIVDDPTQLPAAVAHIVEQHKT